MDSVTKNYLDSPSKKPLDSVTKNSIDITLLGDKRLALIARSGIDHDANRLAYRTKSKAPPCTNAR